jgi:hypothetical protein
LAIFAAVTAWVLLTSLYLEAVDLDQEDVWQRFDDWDVTIAGMSLAILALIVPLAIGFVGSQVKASSAKDVFWDIYLDYCRPALLVGSSNICASCSISKAIHFGISGSRFKCWWYLVDAC